MNKPLVTVIMPVFNVEKYLKAALDSILEQTYPNIHLITIDDGSTDKSSVILDSYANKYSNVSVYHFNNAGQSAARNKALSLSDKGQYLYFMDSDDLLALDAIEKLVNYMEKYNLDAIRFDAQNFIDGQNFKQRDLQNQTFTIKQISKKHSEYTRDEFLKSSWYYSLPVVWAYFIKAEIIEKPTLLKFKEGMIREDTIFIPQLLYRIKTIGYLKETLYFRRVHSNSVTTSYSNSKHYNTMLKVINILTDFSDNIPNEEKTFKKYIETYKTKAFLLLNEYKKQSLKDILKLKKELKVKGSILQYILFIRRSIKNK